MSFSELVGHKIEKIYHRDYDELMFKVLTQDNSYKYYHYRCEGECCNIVYINSIIGLSCLIGETVISAEHKSSDDNGKGLEWDFWTVSTKKGYCDIEVRNDSPDYHYHGDIYLRGIFDEIPIGYKELTKDYE